MDSNINCNRIIPESIVDGPGLRYVVFVQGCPHHCPGCHNPQTHDFRPVSSYTIAEIYAEYIENPLLSGITFSGGEPFCQPAPLALLGKKIKDHGGDVITYTGYYYEDLLKMAQQNQEIKALLDVTDYLVDGPYLESQKNMEISFRGSDNQRIWDLHQKVTLSSF